MLWTVILRIKMNKTESTWIYCQSLGLFEGVSHVILDTACESLIPSAWVELRNILRVRLNLLEKKKRPLSLLLAFSWRASSGEEPDKWNESRNTARRKRTKDDYVFSELLMFRLAKQGFFRVWWGLAWQGEILVTLKKQKGFSRKTAKSVFKSFFCLGQLLTARGICPTKHCRKSVY